MTTALNPECQQGKHDNCDGNALHPDDSIGPCQCPHHTSDSEPVVDLVGRLRASVDAARERRLAGRNAVQE